MHAQAPNDPGWVLWFRRLAAATWFNRFVLLVIVAAGVLAGMSTSDSIMAEYGATLDSADKVIITIFLIEIIVRILSYGSRPWMFFTNAWNIFDFVIVAVCLMPDNEYAAVLRMIRVLRTLRLFSAIPPLQIIIEALLKAIPSISYVGLLLLLQFYIYAVVGTTSFGKNDPVNFGSLDRAMITLFRVVTLEDWTDIWYIQMRGSDVYPYDMERVQMTEAQLASWTPKSQPAFAIIYFISFVLIGTMIVMNLFIGVVVNSMTDAQAERSKELIDTRDGHSLEDQLGKIESQLDNLKSTVSGLRLSASKAD